MYYPKSCTAPVIDGVYDASSLGTDTFAQWGSTTDIFLSLCSFSNAEKGVSGGVLGETKGSEHMHTTLLSFYLANNTLPWPGLGFKVKYVTLFADADFQRPLYSRFFQGTSSSSAAPAIWFVFENTASCVTYPEQWTEISWSVFFIAGRQVIGSGCCVVVKTRSNTRYPEATLLCCSKQKYSCCTQHSLCK